jgi:hypothetical protein
MRTSRSFTEDPAVIPPAQMIVETLVAQLRILIEAIERFDTEIGHTESGVRLPRVNTSLSNSTMNEDAKPRPLSGR